MHLALCNPLGAALAACRLAPPVLLAEARPDLLRAEEHVLLSDLESFFAPSAAAAPGEIDPFLQFRRRRRANSGARSDHAEHSPLAAASGARPLHPPCFSTSVHDDGDGFFDIDLHAGSSQAVGRATFIDRSPSEAAHQVSRALGASCAELKHLDVVPHMRGFDGGVRLMAAMAEVLGGLGCEHVLLLHDERGGGAGGHRAGKLVAYYERCGFARAGEALGADVLGSSRELEAALNEGKHMLARLEDVAASCAA